MMPILGGSGFGNYVLILCFIWSLTYIWFQRVTLLVHPIIVYLFGCYFVQSTKSHLCFVLRELYYASFCARDRVFCTYFNSYLFAVCFHLYNLFLFLQFCIYIYIYKNVSICFGCGSVYLLMYRDIFCYQKNEYCVTLNICLLSYLSVKKKFIKS